MERKPPAKDKGDSRSIWPLLITAVIASASAMFYMDLEQEEGINLWACQPLSTEITPDVFLPCFRALVEGRNTVVLQWKVVDPSLRVYILDDTAPKYDDPGYQTAHCPNQAGELCELRQPVEHGGTFRWVIQVSDDDGRQTHASAEIYVKPLAPPKILSGGNFVDLLDPAQRHISWEAEPDDATGWVEIKGPGALAWSTTRYPLSGPDAQLNIPANTFHSRGDVVFKLRYCRLPAGSASKFCSPIVDAGFKVGYDRFTGHNNLHVPAGEDLDIGFTARSGNARLLSSETLLEPGKPVALAYPDTSYTIPGDRLVAGKHELQLNSCRLPQANCSNRVNTAPAEVSGALWHFREGHYSEGEVIARLYPADDAEVQLILAPATGPTYFHNPYPVDLVEAGDPIAYTITQPADVLNLLVDAPVDWTLNRDYTEDFQPGIALSVEGSGQPLDITFDDEGGIWLLNEFSNSLEYISPAGDIQSFNLPLARTAELIEKVTTKHKVTQPFTYTGVSDRGNPSAISSLAERVLFVNSRIWFTQGGGLQSGSAGPWLNRSRVMSFDPRLKDRPETPHDDRFCAYNMPVDDEFGYGNNQVIGLAAARGRIWVAESRGILSNTQSYLSSFVPSPETCENLLDFSATDAHMRQKLQYCGEGRTPEQDLCVERIAMPQSLKPLKVAHLRAEPDESAIWFSDATGQCLGRYDLDGESGMSVEEFRDKHEDDFQSIAGLGGFPWDIQVSRDAVYVGEYAARHILRFDKATGEYHEISIPYSGPGIRLHSMELDAARNRLWFSLSNECAVHEEGANSTIGYVDLESWRSWVENPRRAAKIQGVVYSGLETIPSCDLHPGRPQAFRGIAIDSKTGTLAIATMLREQVTLLKPLPGFWP